MVCFHKEEERIVSSLLSRSNIIFQILEFKITDVPEGAIQKLALPLQNHSIFKVMTQEAFEHPNSSWYTVHENDGLNEWSDALKTRI